jgi:hypothetical protein
VPGGGQSYVTQTSTGALETASVEDATNVALDGTLVRDSASGTYLRAGVECTKALNERCAAPGAAALGVDIGAIALRVSDDAPPRGAVGGVSSPASGTLALSLFASDAGLGLGSARATLDGALVAQVDLGGASCAELSAQDATIDLPAGGGCPASDNGVVLPVDTMRVADGVHQLRVVVRDAAGNEATVADESITVHNSVAQSSNQATLSLGTSGAAGGASGGGGAGSGAGGGGGGGGSGAAGAPGGTTTTGGPACLKPRLSMMLRSKPLRTFRGVPVLDKRVAYRFTGKLTCAIAGRRAAAPVGTVVEILNVIGKRIASDGGITARRAGALSVLLRYGSSRIVRFRHRSVDKSTASVSIRIAVTHPVVRRP